MLDIQSHQMHHEQDAPHDSNFLFTGSFDDNSFCRGPQFLTPVATSFTKDLSKICRTFSPVASPISNLDQEDFAVLDDDDEYSEDELPPSPRRRHSGAISISSEDLPLCYDRETLKRETAGHRARHQQRLHKLKAGTNMGAFAIHGKWDTEVDGPHMTVWVPESSANGERKRRRVDQPAPESSDSSRPKNEIRVQQSVSEIDGPMMALWGI